MEVFVTFSDAGVGNIVGSALFNLLVIIGVRGLPILQEALSDRPYPGWPVSGFG